MSRKMSIVILVLLVLSVLFGVLTFQIDQSGTCNYVPAATSTSPHWTCYVSPTLPENVPVVEPKVISSNSYGIEYAEVTLPLESIVKEGGEEIYFNIASHIVKLKGSPSWNEADNGDNWFDLTWDHADLCTRMLLKGNDLQSTTYHKNCAPK